jgi:hypothetical protein
LNCLDANLTYFFNNASTHRQGFLLFLDNSYLTYSTGIKVTGSGYLKVDNCNFCGNPISIQFSDYTKFTQASEIKNSLFSSTNCNVGLEAYIKVTNASVAASGGKFGTNGSHALSISNCKFNEPQIKLPEMAGIYSIGSFINVFGCEFQNLSYGLLSESGPYLYGGVWASGSTFYGCDRGIVTLGATSTKSE